MSRRAARGLRTSIQREEPMVEPSHVNFLAVTDPHRIPMSVTCSYDEPSGRVIDSIWSYTHAWSEVTCRRYHNNKKRASPGNTIGFFSLFPPQERSFVCDLKEIFKKGWREVCYRTSPRLNQQFHFYFRKPVYYPESKDLEDSNRFSDRNVQACCCRQSGQESLSFYRVGEEDKKIAECLGRQSHPPIRKKKQTKPIETKTWPKSGRKNPTKQRESRKKLYNI